ncbi:SagB family peptide dehydrogenase [Spirulina sp. 06S082]|uniref:SagB family peptide dehydrogenase n=1 Tax=Spirulina sp. 06S082 TaxID=3110248 RepID=UPI002B201C2D|nr:SagB family peptide dehydrogenase [Spirulina sp. 06S082]MEA5472123.1 SagB family peptide dehydrogenase [Spirulina sp. 06S082]
MTFSSFTLSLREDIAIAQQNTNISLQSPARKLTFPNLKPVLIKIFHDLKQGNKTLSQLQKDAIASDNFESLALFDAYLQKLIQLGWIYHLVIPLAKAVPMVGNYHLDRDEIDWQNDTFILSRFAYLHSIDGEMCLESPLSQSKVLLLDWRSSALIAKLSQPQTVTELMTDIPDLTEAIAQQFVSLLFATQMLAPKTARSPLIFWEFHDLLFHSRSRSGRHDYPIGGVYPFKEAIAPLPVVKPLMGDTTIALYRPDIEALQQTDLPFTQVLEQRRSVREYDEENPITVQQLGELLYRCARVKEAIETEMVELSRRPYPSGGAIYELELYPVVRHCEGLDPGLYQYHPLDHVLCPISQWTPETEALVIEAWFANGQQVKPQVLLVITARFGRLFWKYRGMGYAAILKHVGVMYQNLYLVATSMNLAPTALGTGNSDLFAAASGIDYYQEASVGEFMLGSLC